MKKYFRINWCFNSLLVIIVATYAGADDFCSWYTKELQCLQNEFRCENKERCIKRELYCNNKDDCGDNSDEKYCNIKTCPENFTSCNIYWVTTNKCVPNKWVCDGYKDCSSEKDENSCKSITTPASDVPSITEESRAAIDKVKKWIKTQRKKLSSAEKWGSNVDSLASILFLITRKFDPSLSDEIEMAYELNIRLLSRLSSMKLEDVPSTELASYVNAFLVMCINPKNFHGFDLIQELRGRIGQENYTNPYVLLALCNAGNTITETDKKKLIDVFEDKHRTFWTGMQAIAVMALACANKQPNNDIDFDKLGEMTLELKQQQHTNGTVVNLPTTALVMQALISTGCESDPDHFNELKAFQELLRNQMPDGSFGDVMSTFFVSPVLTCKSLLDINSDHCQYESGDEFSALDNLLMRSGPKIHVQLSLWLNEKKDLKRNLVLHVPQNMSLYGIMEIAAEVDHRFKFEYSVKDRKPYIDAISGIKDNPLKGKFWFLYHIQNGQATLTDKSPADILPKNNDHYVMWYRRGTWVD